MKRAAVILFAALALSSMAGCSTAEPPTQDSQHGLLGADDAAVTTTPEPAPPVTHPVGDLSALSGADANALLTSEHFVVVEKAADGSIVTDTTGWAFQSQYPAAGTQLAEGSTVTLTFAPPPPPPPPPAPAPAPAPVVAPGGGATAQCVDGSLSYSAHRQGTCSHHGGVAVWY